MTDGTKDHVQKDETQRRLLGRTVIDYLLYFPALAVSGVMGLVTVAVLSKLFSPTIYGHYTLALSTLLLLTMITSLWLRAGVLRLLPQYSEANQTEAFIGTLFAAGALVTLIAVALYAGVLFYLEPALDPQLYYLLWLVVPGAPALTAFTVLTAAHRIQQRSVLFSTLTLVRVLGGFAVGVVLVVALDLGAAGMLWGLILVVLSVVIIHVIAMRHTLIDLIPKMRWSNVIFRDLLAYTMPIVGLNVASTVLSVSDRYLIEGYIGSYALGIYAVSYGIAEGGLRLIANTFLIASEPTIFRAWEMHDSQTAFHLIERMFRYYVMLALPALVGLSVLRRDIVRLFSTPEYVVGSAVVLFVGLALFLHGYSLIVGMIFDVTKRTMIPFATFVVAGVINVILNLLLLPRYGYMAAAWSTAISYAVLFGLNVAAARRIVTFQLLERSMVRVGLAVAGMSGITLLVRRQILPSPVGIGIVIAVSILTYGILLVALGGVTNEERRAALTRIRRIPVRVRHSLGRHVKQRPSGEAELSERSTP